MKYYKEDKMDGRVIEVSKESAIKSIEQYFNNAETMLQESTKERPINCMFIFVWQEKT